MSSRRDATSRSEQNCQFLAPACQTGAMLNVRLLRLLITFGSLVPVFGAEYPGQNSNGSQLIGTSLCSRVSEDVPSNGEPMRDRPAESSDPD
jgi:hypothetical protein